MDGSGASGEAGERAVQAGVIAERWRSLPNVIRTLFDSSRSVQVVDVLRALGVSEEHVGDGKRRCFTTARGTLAVTAWHDEIEQDNDGSWVHWIDGYCWRDGGVESGGADSASVRATLQRHVNEDVYVIHLRREIDPDGHFVARNVALDIVTWRLESAGQQWFVVRRPTIRRSDANDTRGDGKLRP